MRSSSADVFASAAFFANIALLLQSGYFDIESAKKPLLHLWSLGIEEQFYLFWPLLLMLAVRLRLSIVAMASILGIGSFVLNVALIGSDPIATFYLPFTRAFELLAGAALALRLERDPPDRRGQQSARLHRRCIDCGRGRACSIPTAPSRAGGRSCRSPALRCCYLRLAAWAVPRRNDQPATGRESGWSVTRSISGTGRYWCFSPSSSSTR